jgi:hypothetical protein
MNDLILPEPKRKTVQARIYEETAEISKKWARILNVSQIEIYRAALQDYDKRLTEAGYAED